MTSSLNVHLNADQVLEIIERDLAQARIARDKLPPAWLAGFDEFENPSAEKLPPNFRMRARGYDVTELLGYDDVQFVQAAYLAILKRRPDPNGLQTYVQRLHTGALSKLEILGRLRLCREGLRQKIAVRGLLPRLAWVLFAKIPILGSGMSGLMGLFSLRKNLARLDARHGALKTELAQMADKLAARDRQLAQVWLDKAGLDKSLGMKTPT